MSSPRSPRYIARPVVRYDVEEYPTIRHLLDRLYDFISNEDQDKIEQDLEDVAWPDSPSMRVAFMRISIYADVKYSEATSSDTSKKTPSGDTEFAEYAGSGSSDDTVDPAALGQRTTGLNFDTVD